MGSPLRQFVVKLHGRCNLACDYCYVFEMADQRWRTRPAAMPVEVQDRVWSRIAEHVRAHGLRRVEVVLHGGEPLLAGAAGLATAAAGLRAALPAEVQAAISVQTNGVLLDESILAVCHEHDIRVGVSIDGDRTGHDRHRRFASGRGSFAAVDRALGLLGRPEHRSRFAGLLCTVDLQSSPLATYEALLGYTPPRMDFLLPHGNWVSPPPGRVTGSAGTPYADWLIAVFDRWFGSGDATDVRLFSSIVRLLLGGDSATESVGLSPIGFVVVATDGSYEQVDTLASAYEGAAATGLDVFAHSLDDVVGHPAIAGRQRGESGLSNTCRRCSLRRVCGGGYYPHRFDGSDFDRPSVYCPDLARLIRHVAGAVRAEVAAARADVVAARDAGSAR